MSETVTFSISGPPDQAEAFKELIKQEALNRGMSMSELIVDAVADYIRLGKNQGGKS